MISRPRRRVRTIVLAMYAAAGVACAGATPAPDTSPSAIPAGSSNGRRAILVSFDSFSERRMMESLPAESVPAIRALFGNGACAAYAQPAFPSLTAPGHASVWTGAYGDISGIAANDQPRLPLDEHTLLESISGFSFEALRAEPLWLTAGRAGVSVVGHHVTQAPGPPGYPSVYGMPDDSLLALRSAAARDIRLPAIALLNGYNRRLAGDTVLTEWAAPPRPASTWRNLEALASGVPPLEIAWMVGADSIFAVLHGERAYDRITVGRLRDAELAMTAPAAGPDTTALSGRPLARFYSAPIPLPVHDGVAHLVVRLFSLSADGLRFELFMPEVNVVQANRPDVAAAYGSAVGGWVGNAAASLLRRGGFGRRLTNGGTGGAEARWLDAAEYLTRQSMRGVEWAWHDRGATLLLDYFPLGDEADHMLYGEVAPGAPGWAEYDREAIARVRIRAWELVDRRLGGLQTLVGGDSSAILVVTGDHGMRPTWRVFRPNVALAEAGLLARGANGQPDLARTRALTPNGYFISMNTVDHRGGIVPLDSAATIRAAARRALRAVRDENGEPVVTGVWDAEEIDTLGAGGPAGGDLYFELAPGYRSTRAATGAVTEATSLDAGHGFLSTSPDMHTVLCAYGARVAPRRSEPARTIDAAPTISEWLGIPAPHDARGRSRLGELLGR
jgi:hypothetical protein